MTRTETIAFVGIGLTFLSLLKAAPQSDETPPQWVPTQPWAGAGTDPFGKSYTVTGRARRGGL